MITTIHAAPTMPLPPRHLFLVLGLLVPYIAITPAPATDTPLPAPGTADIFSAQVDLRPRLAGWGLVPRSQGKRPTCSVVAFTGALEFAVAHARNRGERLSPEFLNWAANQTGRATRDGGFFSDMWNGFAKQGICAESMMPYQAEFDPARAPDPGARTDAQVKLALGLRIHWIKRWNVKTGLSDDEFAAIKQALNRGWPVCGGLRWPKLPQWRDNVLRMCAPAEVFDGHSVLLAGYRDDAGQPGGGVFIFRNSNGDTSDGSMPFLYAQTFMNDALWIDNDRATDKAPAAGNNGGSGTR